MPQIFPKSFNAIAKLSLLAAAVLAALLGWAWYEFNQSQYVTQIGMAHQQEIPFSHRHHVQGLGIDCRYCHTDVEKGPYAGIPPTETCMNCHSVMWSQAPALEAVRESYRTGEPLEWSRVHDLPDFVYFDHSIHVAKGIACVTCHGRIDQQPFAWKNKSLQMTWCLDCHRHPEKYVRPKEAVFEMEWETDAGQIEMGRKLVKEYDITSVTTCSACHR